MIPASELISMLPMMAVNLSYAAMCIMLGILAMVVGYKIFDKLTPFNTADILEKDPRAVGIFNAAIVLGVSVCSGIIIGMACN